MGIYVSKRFRGREDSWNKITGNREQGTGNRENLFFSLPARPSAGREKGGGERRRDDWLWFAAVSLADVCRLLLLDHNLIGSYRGTTLTLKRGIVYFFLFFSSFLFSQLPAGTERNKNRRTEHMRVEKKEIKEIQQKEKTADRRFVGGGRRKEKKKRIKKGKEEKQVKQEKQEKQNNRGELWEWSHSLSRVGRESSKAKQQKKCQDPRSLGGKSKSNASSIGTRGWGRSSSR